tara:strand:+ start:135 stop:866 length:732 start_codon:yes stop_codon:yes gene_type:complete
MKYADKLFEIYKNYMDPQLKRRIQMYVDDEPETIKWIESFSKNSIFYDVGSNIGGFSIICNLSNPSVKTYSFEPNFINFFTQVEACKDNKIKNLFPFNVAINDKNEFNYFKYDWLTKGAKGTFGEVLKEQMKKSDYSNPFKRGINLEVGILGVSLDSLVYDFKLPIPNYLKIDVDGNDFLVLKGAKRLLDEGHIEEILVEIDDKIYVNGEFNIFMKNYSYEVAMDINVGTNIKPFRMVLYRRV